MFKEARESPRDHPRLTLSANASPELRNIGGISRREPHTRSREDSSSINYALLFPKSNKNFVIHAGAEGKTLNHGLQLHLKPISALHFASLCI
jgi:hypothetical protein